MGRVTRLPGKVLVDSKCHWPNYTQRGTIVGMKAGEQLTLTVPSKNAFENIFLRFLLCFCLKKSKTRR